MRGELAPGATLPSVRALAAREGVSPGTVHRALAHVEESGLVAVRGRSRVTVLNEDGRVVVLARMLGGAKVTKTTRAHAHELLHHAQKG